MKYLILIIALLSTTVTGVEIDENFKQCVKANNAFMESSNWYIYGIELAYTDKNTGSLKCFVRIRPISMATLINERRTLLTYTTDKQVSTLGFMDISHGLDYVVIEYKVDPTKKDNNAKGK